MKRFEHNCAELFKGFIENRISYQADLKKHIFWSDSPSLKSNKAFLLLQVYVFNVSRPRLRNSLSMNGCYLIIMSMKVVLRSVHGFNNISHIEHNCKKCRKYWICYCSCSCIQSERLFPNVASAITVHFLRWV